MKKEILKVQRNNGKNKERKQMRKDKWKVGGKGIARAETERKADERGNRLKAQGKGQRKEKGTQLGSNGDERWGLGREKRKEVGIT